MKITPDTWNDILTLMACVLLADETVLENEVLCFQKNAHLLAHEMKQDIGMNDALLRQWFELKRETIVQSMIGEKADNFIMNIALSLEDFPAKKSLLKALINISASDADLHKSEIDILNLAAAYWGLPPVNRYRS